MHNDDGPDRDTRKPENHVSSHRTNPCTVAPFESGRLTWKKYEFGGDVVIPMVAATLGSIPRGR